MLSTRKSGRMNSPSASDAAIEALVRDAYNACHLDDTFDDLKRRAGVSREAAGLLRAWRKAAQTRGLAPASPPCELAADRADELAA